jgi:hypothetical protein
MMNPTRLLRSSLSAVAKAAEKVAQRAIVFRDGLPESAEDGRAHAYLQALNTLRGIIVATGHKLRAVPDKEGNGKV